ncbi:glycolipid transfer protein HET-C2 [Blumeria hordei DH14]|uniref:Glycolipid transfer protein HET-C2 n=1 Tax=Blumeria graminis f. sp. hordei (strain DH14) TaxID=546991 RepID=N1J5K3_BLUG1|nr:glycolipid transfer protein HET-C2 [Blumeria hordei DH14]
MAATKAYPEGGSFLQTFKRSFTDVPISEAPGNAVSTTEFLEAAESLSGLFDVLGSMAFQPVKKDILGNIKKVRDRQAAAPTKSKNLQDLVRDELSMKRHTATEGLVWLVRGLDFTALALTQNLAESSEELSKSFRGAYTVTLQPYHSVFVKPIFSAAMMACPYRKDFYASLGNDEAKVVEELRVWLAALQKVLVILKEFLKSSEAKW